MLVCLFFTSLFISLSKEAVSTLCQLTGQKIALYQFKDSFNLREAWNPKYGSLYHQGKLKNPGIRMPFKCKNLNNDTKFLLIQSKVILNQQTLFSYYPIILKQSNQYNSNDYRFFINSKVQRLAKFQLEGGYISPARITLSHGPVYYPDIQNNTDRTFTNLKLYQCPMNLSLQQQNEQQWFNTNFIKGLPGSCVIILWNNVQIKLSAILLIINLLLTIYI